MDKIITRQAVVDYRDSLQKKYDKLIAEWQTIRDIQTDTGYYGIALGKRWSKLDKRTDELSYMIRELNEVLDSQWG